MLGGQEVMPVPSLMEWLGPVPGIPGGDDRAPDDLTDVEEMKEDKQMGRGALAAMDRRRTTRLDFKGREDEKRKRALTRWLRIAEEAGKASGTMRKIQAAQDDEKKEQILRDTFEEKSPATLDIAPKETSVAAYARDLLAHPLRELQKVLDAIRNGTFDPDATRAGAFKKKSEFEIIVDEDEDVAVDDPYSVKTKLPYEPTSPAGDDSDGFGPASAKDPPTTPKGFFNYEGGSVETELVSVATVLPEKTGATRSCPQRKRR